MTLTVFLAVIFAALLHAIWNALVKSGADKHQAMAAVVIGHIPFALVALLFVPLPDPASLPWLAGGIALHLGYHLFLLAAYRIGDLSHVYPLARGSAPLIVTLISVGFLGVALEELQVLAVIVIACGILSLAVTRRSDGQANGRAAALALITGCFIAAYSLVDGYGARAAGTAVGFFAWLSIGDALLFAAVTAVIRPGVLTALPRQSKRLMFVGGGASFVAFSIVMWAFTQAPIALVTALRETSIVFALIIGVFGLGERLNIVKLLSVATTLLGVILLRTSRP